MLTLKAWRNTLIVFVILGMVLYGFAWNEARKELKFLCANFGVGVAQTSVIRQLDTGNWLDYQVTPYQQGVLIVAASDIHLSAYSCVVTLDNKGKVISALFE